MTKSAHTTRTEQRGESGDELHEGGENEIKPFNHNQETQYPREAHKHHDLSKYV